MKAMHVNALAASGDSPCGRLAFQPDAENIQRCVDIAIVRRSAVQTFPTPHSKRAHAFWAAGGNRSASRARLGTVSFVGLDEHGSVPSGLVAEHVSEPRPARIEHGFCKPRSGQAGGVHIADDDQAILPNDPSGLLVEMVAPSVRDLRMDRAHPTLAFRPIGDRESCFIFAEVLEGGDFASVAQCGEVFQAKVYADRPRSRGEIVSNLALEGDVPPPARVLDELAAAVLTADVARLPEAVAALEIDSCIAVYAYRSRYEGYPTQRAPSSEASAEPGAAAVLVAGRNELSADLSNGIGMQSEIGGYASREADQVESRGPSDVRAAFALALGLALRRDAEVPNLIASDRVTAEVPLTVFDPIFEGQKAPLNHGLFLAQIEGARQ